MSVYDDVIPPEMWVFYPAATREEIEKYKNWCINQLNYIPYIDTNLVIFENSEDTVLFKLSFSYLL